MNWLSLMAGFFAVGLGAAWFRSRARQRADRPASPDDQLAAAVVARVAEARHLLNAYVALLALEHQPVILRESSLPESKERIKLAILHTAATEFVKGTLSTERKSDYRDLYAALARFGSDEEAAKSAAIFVASRHFRSVGRDSPDDLVAIGKVIGQFADGDLIEIERQRLAGEFDSRWARTAGLAPPLQSNGR